MRVIYPTCILTASMSGKQHSLSQSVVVSIVLSMTFDPEVSLKN
jgi:hypothetical protein